MEDLSTPARKRRNRGRGEGSICRRKDGRWQGAYTPPGGKRLFLYGKTRREVADRLADVLRDIRTGQYVAPSKITTGEYLTHWVTQSIRPNVREATYISYEAVVRVHLVAGLGDVPLQELSPPHIEAYKNKKLLTKSPRSVAYQLTLLRAALDQAVRWGYIQRNPAMHVDKPRVPRFKHDRLTKEQARVLLSAIQGDRLEALYVLGLTTGMRRGELLGLHWTDIDFERGSLSVRTTLLRQGGHLILAEPKTDKGRRVVALSRMALNALSVHRARQDVERGVRGRKWEDNGLVFPAGLQGGRGPGRGRPMEPRNLNRHFRLLCERAGLPPMRVHDLRHSAASLMEAQGVSLKTLSTLLGHSTIQITGDLYVQPYDASMGDAAQRMDDLLSD